MTPNEIFEALATAGPGRFPREALIEAAEQREAMTPLLLDELRRQVDAGFAPAMAIPGYWRHHFAIYLLGYFREPAAYPLFLAMAALPGETLFDAIGDTVTEGFGRQLAAVCQGDRAGIERLIEDPAVNEYVRSAAMSALEVLLAIGELDLTTLRGYLGTLASGWLGAAETGRWDGPATGFLWSVLAHMATGFGAEELVPTIRRAYALGLVDELFGGGVGSFERAMAEQLANPMPYEPLGHTGLPGHPVEELAHWAAFRSEKPTARRASAPAFPRRVPAPTHQPRVRAGPKVGRNDPCPCGSGRKYKKCCGA
jgi:hypothetical protein